MDGYHVALAVLVKLNTEVVEPLDGLRTLCDKLIEKVFLGSIMSAAVGVQEMLCRGVAGFCGGLDTTLCHHGIGVSEAEFCADKHLGTGLVGLNGSGAAGSASSDDEDVGIIVRMFKIHVVRGETGMALKGLGELNVDALPLVLADFQLLELVLAVVRMELFQQNFFVLCGHALRLKRRIVVTLLRYFFEGSLKIFWIHIRTLLPYFSISRLL